MTQQDLQQADAVVLDLHKRAYFGRLAQKGIAPTTEKEAQALLDLGFDLAQSPLATSQSGDYGRGEFAQIKAACDQALGREEAPGFPKSAGAAPGFPATLPEIPPALRDAAYGAAFDLAHDPTVYQAAVIKRAMVTLSQQAQAQQQTQAWAQQQQAAKQTTA